MKPTLQMQVTIATPDENPMMMIASNLIFEV